MYDINDKLRNHNKADYCFTIMCTNRVQLLCHED